MQHALTVLLACILAIHVAEAAKLVRGRKEVAASCARDSAVRMLVQAKLKGLAIPCENMCKKLGAYPNCQCPGFEGEPATDDDTRACMTKNCQDPSAPCPNDAFVTCVTENTKVSVLQWGALMSNFDKGLQSLVQTSQTAADHAGSALCSAHDIGARALLQARLSSWAIPCENMCKKLGAYPNCQCPGFEGEPASDDDTRACMTKYCQDPAAPCPNDNFVTCVKENTKVSVLQWGALLSSVDRSFKTFAQATNGKRLRSLVQTAQNATVHAGSASCSALDMGARALLQAKLTSLAIPCENMCKKLGAYPNCQCPGFEGEPASDDDTRACMTKYCQDPAAPCPNDEFVTCVKENTKVSVLQWGALLSSVDRSVETFAQAAKGNQIRSLAQTSQQAESDVGSASCGALDIGARALLQAKLSSLAIPCENMCKKLGAYPNCQCPGFEGEPASDDDTRACMTKYCQDPAAPCPNDEFVTCVKENTKVSVLQWGALLSSVDRSLETFMNVSNKKETKGK